MVPHTDTPIEEIKLEALDRMAVPITIVDTNGQFVYCNESSLRVLGYSLSEMQRMHWQQLQHEPQTPQELESIYSSFCNKGFWEGSQKLVTKAGVIFPAQVHLAHMPEGYVSCVFTDISEQLERDAKLANLSAAVESAMDGIALLGPDEKYYYLNDRHVKHFGYEHEEELLGKTWRIIYPEHEIKRIEEDLFPKLMRDGRWQGETLGIKKNGGAIHQEITLTALPSGGLICIMRNITEKKLREAEIKKLALVASKTNNAVVITDNQLVIDWMNDSAESIFRIKLFGSPGIKISTLIQNMKLSEEERFQFSEQLKTGKPFSAELHLETREGKPLWLHVEVNPIYEQDRTTYFVFLFLDITTIKEAEHNLSHALEKEKHLNDLKSHFVTLTSHEFRTPLTSIQSSLDILNLHLYNYGLVNQEKLTQHLDQITEEVQRMTELMDNVLVLGKINTGKINFQPDYHDLEPLLKDVVNNKRINQYNKRIKLSVNGTPIPVYCDLRLLEHILNNLLINALKYSEHSPEPPELEVVFGKEEVAFTITDYGIGVPEEDQPHLFESFYRAANAHNIPGTGLGLPIVKQFVELHNGSIGFESKLNQKTIFHFNIPLNNHV